MDIRAYCPKQTLPTSRIIWGWLSSFQHFHHHLQKYSETHSSWTIFTHILNFINRHLNVGFQMVQLMLHLFLPFGARQVRLGYYDITWESRISNVSTQFNDWITAIFDETLINGWCLRIHHILENIVVHESLRQCWESCQRSFLNLNFIYWFWRSLRIWGFLWIIP